MNLSPRQQQVLDFIRTFCADKGWPPTRAEIAAHFGWKSANAANDHILTLERKGVLEVRDGQSRGLRVIA